MKPNLRFLSVLCVALTVGFGSPAIADHEKKRAVIGGGIGAVVGGLLGHDVGGGVGAVIGGGLGAVLGAQIGADSVRHRNDRQPRRLSRRHRRDHGHYHPRFPRQETEPVIDQGR
ncbi:MAG: YMGG-like glycine zipper-containing protein [Pseudomonadota bacterium]